VTLGARNIYEGCVKINCIGSLLLLLFTLTASGGLASGQAPSSKGVDLPSSARLSEIEIRWQSGGGDGCAQRGGCSHYRITLSGDGFVELEQFPWGPPRPKPQVRIRPIAADQIVVLVNEFFKARFFEAPDHYNDVFVATQKADVIMFGISGGIGGGYVDLTLRLGPTVKTVRLGENTPLELSSLKDHIWRIAGPEAWAAR
jgi:hypothetical protein